MKCFDFRAKHNAAKKGDDKITITRKNLTVVKGSGVSPIEKKLGKEQIYTFKAKNLISTPVFNLLFMYLRK